ncbi:MAG: energy transducer TonB [Pseudomonadota bacterium]
MTMHLASSTFDEQTAHPLRALPRNADDGRNHLGAFLVTVLIHVGVVLAFILAVRVAAPIKAPLALMIQLEQPKKEKLDLKTPPPALIRPTVVTALPPDVMIQTPPRAIQAAPPVAEPAPPALHAPVAQNGVGDGQGSFESRVLAHINRFKQYPPAARKAHIEGVVMLHFVMDATGHVTQADIQKSSGRPILDNEALAMIQRAQPLPALPADYPARVLDAVVSIEFSLNN